MAEQVVTMRQVAQALKVSPSTVSRWAAAGLIPSLRGVRAIRFDLDAVKQALENRPEERQR